MDFSITISWGTVVTVAITQVISTTVTFYMLKFLNTVHQNGGTEKIKKGVSKAVKNAQKNLNT